MSLSAVSEKAANADVSCSEGSAAISKTGPKSAWSVPLGVTSKPLRSASSGTASARVVPLSGREGLHRGTSPIQVPERWPCPVAPMSSDETLVTSGVGARISEECVVDDV